MRYLIISDIHGSLDDLKQALTFFEKEQCEGILILGDELYHGPRNSIPKGYNPSEVSKLLNTYKDQIVAIRGNCEAEVDQMLLEYPVMDTYKLLKNGDKTYFLTHGHIYSEDNLPEENFDIMLSGHTHIPLLKVVDQHIFVNPGSITFPKNNTPKCVGIIDEERITILSLAGGVFLEKKL